MSGETLRLIVTAGWGAYLVILVVWIVLQKRSPAVTLSWILALAFLPVVGYVVFLIFGPQRLRRYEMRRLRSRLKLACGVNPAERAGAVPVVSPSCLSLARLGAATCDAPLSSATEVKLLVGGDAKFADLLDAIANAQHHVHLEYYIYEPDQTGTRLRDALVERARAGVQVRLLLDALGAMRVGRRFFAPLLEAGGEVAFFHGGWLGRHLRPLINYRTHRKIVVCDGRIGFTGGINVTDDGVGAVNPHPFQDVHLRLEGAVVLWLQTVFLEDWYYTRRNEAPTPELLSTLLPPAEPGPCVAQILHSGPNDARESIHRYMVEAIASAQQRVWLTTPYFVPTHPALMSLTSAALRGVDVRVLVPARSDSRFVSAAARSYYDELLRAGVTIWEYQDRMLHAKTLLIDDRCSVVGTANFDNRSFALNFEVAAVVYGEAMAERLERQFEEDLRGAKGVPRERKMRMPQRLGEAGARLFSPLL